MHALAQHRVLTVLAGKLKSRKSIVLGKKEKKNQI